MNRGPTASVTGDPSQEHSAPPRTRPAVHVASGKRLGAAHPRQEGPTDLRLVPPALAAWATAAMALEAPAGWVTGFVAACLAAAAVLLLARQRRGRSRRSRATPALEPASAPAPAPAHPPSPPPPSPPTHPRNWARTSVAAVLLGAAAAAASAGLHGADVRRGPVPALARQYATVTAEVELTSDPRLTRPRVSGDHMAPVSVLIDAEVRQVERVSGAGTMGAARTRAPVLILVDTGGQGHDAGARRSPWLGLLPSTRLSVTARLAPPLSGGGRVAAVLRVRGRAAPEVIGGPSGPQRLAGRLRAGLRTATDGLPQDARALLPGLVVGDTTRVTPDLDEAFKETDLAHTLAVSGSNLTILLALLVGPLGLAQHVERRGLVPRLGLSLRATALLCAVLTLGFVVVCRPDPSVLRAAACGAVALLA
ncbi:ComEC/Rec2 family competence protein, partial [Streptomyces carpinensis]